MGAYRLLLAYLVVFYHVSGPIHLRNTGVIAVISFLLLSGFVMTALINKYYLSVQTIPAFYLDRLMRLGPQFYLYSGVTLLAALSLGFRHRYMVDVPSAWHSFLQFMVVPLNFFQHFPNDMLIPQAWSLGLEATFYAIFPIILIMRWRLPAALASFGVFLLAYAGVVDTDLYGYRYLPGVLFIFICGSWLATSEKAERSLPFIVCALAGALLALRYIFPRFDLPYNRDVLIGLIIGIPAVFLLKSIRWQGSIAGDLSYGVFLNHVLILGAVETFAATTFRGIGASLIICALATVCSYFSFISVERPLVERRRQLRSTAPATLLRTF